MKILLCNPNKQNFSKQNYPKKIMIENKRILAVIPARGGSKEIPKKNIKLLNGKPLIEYIYATARKSKHIDKIILSTDNEEIAKIGSSIGIEVPFLRPNDISQDFILLIDVVKHAMKYFDDEENYFDGVMSLQPTSPFLTTDSIDKAIEIFIDGQCDSVTTIAQIKVGHPYISKRLKENNVIENFSVIPEGAITSPRQKREVAYYLTGGLYLRSRPLVENSFSSGHCLGNDSRAVVVKDIEAIDINTLLDFEFAEFMIKRDNLLK